MSDNKNLPPKEETVVSVSKDRIEKKQEKSADWGGNIVPAFFFIFLGLLFLANNLGFISWIVWAEVWKFWPVFLILLGFQFLFGKSVLARIAMILITLAVLLLIFLYIVAGSGALTNTQFNNVPLIQRMQLMNKSEIIKETNTISGDEFQNVEERKITIDTGIGELILSDSDSPDYFTVDSQYPDNYNKPEVNVVMTNNLLDIDAEFPGRGRMMGMGGINNRFTYNTTIGRPEILTELDVTIGAGKAEAKFDTVLLKKISFEVGVGSANITLNENSVPSEELEIEAGVGSITVTVPENIGLEVDYNVGLGKLAIDDQEVRGEGKLKTSNYTTSSKKLHVIADVGTGSIQIQKQ